MLMSTLNDALDIELLQKGLFKQNICNFDPNETIKLVLDSMSDQIYLKHIMLST